jgi:hypothetical protein
MAEHVVCWTSDSDAPWIQMPACNERDKQGIANGSGNTLPRNPNENSDHKLIVPDKYHPLTDVVDRLYKLGSVPILLLSD